MAILTPGKPRVSHCARCGAMTRGAKLAKNGPPSPLCARCVRASRKESGAS